MCGVRDVHGLVKVLADVTLERQHDRVVVVEVVVKDESGLGWAFVDEQKPGHVVGQFHRNATQEGQGQVDMREGGAGGQEGAVGDDHVVKVDPHGGEACAEWWREKPRGGSAPSIQEPGLGQGEHTGAGRRQADVVGVDGSKCLNDALPGWAGEGQLNVWPGDRAQSRHDDDVEIGQLGQGPRRADRHAGRTHDAAP